MSQIATPSETATRWNAADYHCNSAAQQLWARELIAKLRLRGDESLLDLGCGDGKVTVEIAAQLPRGRVIGADVSSEMIEFAQRNFPPAGHPNLSFVHADASRLPFEAEFDVAFSNAALHWIVDHRPVLRGIARALKPGGRALLQMGGQGNAADMLAVIDSLIAEPSWRAYFERFQFRYGFHGVDSYRRWLTEAGLNPLRVELLPKQMIHESIDRFAGWVRTTWLPYIQAVQDARRSEFIGAVIDRYAQEHPPDGNERITVRMVRLEVEARKPAATPKAHQGDAALDIDVVG
jgi:trans-aconitate 2-methyltransferase